MAQLFPQDIELQCVNISGDTPSNRYVTNGLDNLTETLHPKLSWNNDKQKAQKTQTFSNSVHTDIHGIHVGDLIKKKKKKHLAF